MTYKPTILGRLRLALDRFIRRRLPPCKDIVKIISASFDRELTLREKWVMKLHVFACRPCTRYFAQSEFLVSATHVLDQKLKEEALDGELTDDVRQRIKKLLKAAAETS
jgi:hypothetical protein